MPPPFNALNEDGTPATPITVSFEGGETSDTFVREFWNDKFATSLSPQTRTGIRAKLLNAIPDGIGGYLAFTSFGTPMTEERWGRIKIVKYLSTPDAGATVIETTEGATGTQPFGTNSDLAIRDLAPQEGVRVELKFIAPGGQAVNAGRVTISVADNLASAPLSQGVTLPTGAGVLPADRISNFRSLLFGSAITADDSDTIVIAGGQQSYDGAVTTFLASDETFSLEDSAAADLGAGDFYRVTLSRNSAGVIVVTKGLTNVATNPDKPADNILVDSLTVTSADGISVAVAQSSVQNRQTYAEFNARAGTGLTALISRGDGVTGSDHSQSISHETPVSLAASVTNRVWRLGDGSWLATATDAAPEFGADLTWLFVTDTGAVTSITDMRKFTHRAITEWHPEVSLVAVLSDVAAGESETPFAWLVCHDDAEIESISLDLSDTDASWTADGVKVDVLVMPSGAPITDAATSLFTDSATDDQRPVIAFDATSLQSITRMHQVRRIAKGSRILFRIVETVASAAPGTEPEQEIRVALHARRYR